MDTSLPRALINGIDVFGAKKLTEELLKKDLVVFGMGEYIGELGDKPNFHYINNINQVNGIRYVFDYLNDEMVAKKANEWESKLTIIDFQRKNIVGNGDWRVVEPHGVYGEGMLENNEETQWLITAIKQAVQNQNLELPERDSELRLLSLNNLTEVILRASFLSGTSSQVFKIWGATVKSDQIAQILIDQAKMTRYTVIENKFNSEIQNLGEEIEEEWKKLRWQPENDLEEGLKETLQYFFTKMDEENRAKRNKKTEIIKTQPEVIEEEVKLEEIKSERVRYETVVETEEKVEIEPIEEKIEIKEVANKKEELGEMDEVEEVEEIEEDEEPFEEIKPLINKKENFWEKKVKEMEKQNKEPEIEIVKPIKKEILVTEEIKKTKNKKKKSWGLGWVAGGLIIIALIMIGVSGWGQYRLVKKTLGLEKLVDSKKYDEVVKEANEIQKKVSENETKLSDWGWNRFYWGRNYQSVLRLWNESMILINKLMETAKISDTIGEAVLNNKTIEWNKQWGNLKNNLKEIDEEMGILLARMSGNWNWLPAVFKGKWQIAKNDVEEYKQMVDLTMKTMDLWPEFLGVDGKRREYLVLLQNENELRPGGGFIGSYAILSFNNGSLLSFDVKDVYEADGQLKGHVEPPQPIRDYLKEGGWYMRDANWNADFTVASKDIQWFFEKETGRKVDGVVGVNLAVARAVLEAIGEVYVPDFKAKINKDNLYEQAEYYSENKSFAGSTQKSSFLGGLGKQLFEEIKNSDTKMRLELVKALLDQLTNNEIRLALNNQSSAKIVADLGWDGAIYRGKCAQERCFADYLYLVEANLGVNKANYFLYRNIEQTVEINTQSIARNVKINYENTAKNNSWPGGDYVNYLRVYIPNTANIVEVSVTDPAGVKTVFNGEQLKVSEVSGKKEIGLLVTVPVNSKRVVEVKYNNQVDLSKGNKFSYLNYIQKQSGYGDTGLVTLMSVPENWQVEQVEPMTTIINGKLLFNQKLTKDIKMGVEISN